MPALSQSQKDFRYFDAVVQRHDIEDATLAVRIFGNGPPLLFIHGYPVHGYTWRKIVPSLQPNYTCYVVDLPGLGDSDWTSHTDFGFVAQARRLSSLLRHLDVARCAVIAHDTGATIARLLALQTPDCITRLALINTEIPAHRPPWIRFYQFSTKLPLHKPLFRILLGNQRFLKSPMGLAQFYSDKTMLDEPTHISPYMDPLVNSSRRLGGMLGYLKGIDWEAVDSMATQHRNIRSEVLCLWGEDDQTFPVEIAETMTQQFASRCEFVRIPCASLLPHEEQPKSVLRHLLPFLSRAEVQSDSR